MGQQASVSKHFQSTSAFVLSSSKAFCTRPKLLIGYFLCLLAGLIEIKQLQLSACKIS